MAAIGIRYADVRHVDLEGLFCVELLLVALEHECGGRLTAARHKHYRGGGQKQKDQVSVFHLSRYLNVSRANIVNFSQ